MKDILWRIINKIDLGFRYIYILLMVGKADIVLTATSAQTNLGDHAISIAERNFFKRYFSEYKVVEVSKELYNQHRNAIRRKVKPNAIVVISGGGFLGNLWMTEENLVREVLNDFKDNKVIVFPQTIFFSCIDDEYEKSFASYKKVVDFTINARDKNSYDILIKELLPNKVHYIPDIVLSFDYQDQRKRENIGLICIRNDKENCLADEEIKYIITTMKSRINIRETTTIMNHIVPISFRNHYVMKKLNEIASSKVVVTNRLHMMIFAAVTGTPCIAIDNLSRKVSGVYQWIKTLPYIKLLENVNEFQVTLDNLLEFKEGKFCHEILDDFYLELRNEFKEKIDAET